MPNDTTPADGGPAENLTVRDAFAGLALEAILSNRELLAACVESSTYEKRPVTDVVAETAYRYAEGMLRHRSK